MPDLVKAKRNPTGWRWELIRFLIGHTIEAVPLLPHRVVTQDEVLIVRLGEPNFYNTAEVKVPVPTKELIPMEHPAADPFPNTFMAIDLDSGERVVGTFVRWTEADEIELIEARTLRTVVHPYCNIRASYWAPLGYRVRR